MNDLPFPKCWWVTDRLLAGPVFFAGSREEVLCKIGALKAIGVQMIVSLVGIGQFYADEDEAEETAWEIAPSFIWLGFDFPDGTAPDPQTMQIMLDWIDAGLRGDGKVFAHCTGGCGRTGTLIGCWLARHAIAEGEAVLDYLDELRIAADLPTGCPETPAQRQLVTSWRKNQ
jgi:hypothetical protein